MIAMRAWSNEEIWALGERAKVEDAASVVGIGKHKAYRQLNAHGRLKATVDGEEFLIPAYKVCDRWWVSMGPIRELLRIEPPKDSPLGTRLSQGGNGEEPAATRLLASVPEPPQRKDRLSGNSTRR